MSCLFSAFTAPPQNHFFRIAPYFQYHPRMEQKGGLIAEIAKVVNQPDLHVNFLISLREDSYAKLDRLRGHIPTILDICLPIEHLDKQAAQEAITQPIEKYNQEVALEQSVKITPDLVEALLQGIPRVERSGNGRAGIEKLESILENQILSPYLQLVMTRLWDEMVKTNSHCLNLQMLTKLADKNAKDDNEKITSAIKNIVKEHVSATMRSLSAQEQAIAARSFQYLVTPSGTKYAYSVADLANLVGCQSTELDHLLQKLAKNQRIIRSVGSRPDQPDVQQYEIFHDFLAAAILEWRKQYLEEKQKKQNLQKWILIGLGIVALSSVPLGSIVSYRRGVEIYQLKATQSLQQFEAGQQIEALQQAIKSGQAVQQWVQNNPLSFLLGPRKQQSISQARFSLQQILAKIQQQNQVSAFSGQQVQAWNFSQDAQTLATGSADGTVRLWSLQTGKLLTPFKASGPVLNLSFSPNGETLATVSVEGTVQRWSWQTGKEQGRFQATAPTRGLSFSPTSPILAIPSDEGTVQLWNWQTGNQLPHQFKPSGAILDFSFNPSSPIFAITTGDGTVQLWNWQTGSQQAKLKSSGPVFNLCFSADGQTLAALSSEGRVQVWQPQKSPQPVTLPATSSETVSSLSLNSDGKTLVTGSTDGTVQLWDWQAGKLQTSFKVPDAVAYLRFGPDNQTLITVLANGTLSLWTLSKRNEPIAFQSSEPVVDLSFSPDGQTLLAAAPDGAVQVWDWQTGKLQSSPFKPPKPLSVPGLSRDGQSLAGVLADAQTIQVWDWKARNLQTPLKASSPVNSLDLSWDGKMLATLSVDGTIQVWDWKTRKKEAELNMSGRVVGLSFSPDGQTLATRLSDGTLQLWGWRSGKPIRNFPIPSSAASNPGFSLDGKTLAIAFTNRTIGVWDLSGNPIAQFKSSQFTYTLSFSPDGQTLASASPTGEVKLWKLESLDDLLAQGCRRLQPYLESHPDRRRDRPCPRR